MLKFVGWVPTVTGNLSFAIVGQCRNPKRAFKAYRAIGDKRFVVVAQKRRASDTPFSWFGDLLDWSWKRRGYSVYIFFGVSSRDESFMHLSGPCVELSPKKYKALKEKLFVLQRDQDALDDEAYEGEFQRLAILFSSEADELAGSVSAIDLQRNGRMQIVTDETDPDSGKLSASQVFFFIRDVCHVHQHHAPSSDTIIDVVSEDVGETGWKRETLYALYRWVIQQKRAKSKAAFVNALGVMTYASAFWAMHGKSDADELPEYLHSETVASLDIGLKQCEVQEASRSGFVETFFGRSLPLFATVLAVLTPLYSLENVSNPSAQQLATLAASEWFNKNVLFVVFSAFLVTLLAHVAWFYRVRIFIRSLSLDLLRVLFALPYWLVVIGLILLTLSTGALIFRQLLPVIA